MSGSFLSFLSFQSCKPAINRLFLSGLLCSLLVITVFDVRAENLNRGPYLQMGTQQSMTVKWRTDVSSPSSVTYGTELNDLSGTASGADGLDHRVLISGLQPDTRYYYALLDESGGVLAGGDSSHFFYTSPNLGNTELTRVWVIGDSGTADSNARAVRDAYLTRTGSEYTDLWIMLGDNAYSTGTDNEYQAAVFDLYPELLKQSPLWATLGNHDGASADSASQDGPYYDIFTLPTNGEAGGVPSGTEAYYSFDYGQIHFICLESHETDRASNGAMLTWLVNDLEATSQPWIIAYWHHPPYTKGSHNSDSESRLIEMRENALPILESYGVDLVLSGHSHSYERSYLIDSHYGSSTTFSETMKLDGGNGQKTGDGSYQKTVQIQQANNGAVYVVAGSSGKISGGALNHPAMYASINRLGSLIVEVIANELTATFIDNTNAVQDKFTITKGLDILPPELVSVEAIETIQIRVDFSENITSTSANNPANYQLDNGAVVLWAQLSANQREVTLTTSALTPSQLYTLTVNGIEDISLNTIVADTQQTFTYINLITVAFQDGVSPAAGYAGTSDAYISELNGDTNYGASSSLFIDGDDGGGVDLSSLLRWDISQIPGNATVESAAITLDVFNPSASSYDVFALYSPWVEGEVTWQQYRASMAWESAGGQGGSDRGSIVLSSISPSTGLFTTNLNLAGIEVVQSWVDGAVNNNGFIIANTSASDGADFYSSESTSFHPKLTLVYSLPEPEGDSEAPSRVENLQLSSVTTESASMSWNAATDNVAVAGYKILRDDVMIATSLITSFDDGGLTPATDYAYKVIAFDGANNESAPSAPLNVTTNAIAASVHVEQIAMAIESVNRKKLRAQAEVWVVDNMGSGIGNVAVQGGWTGLSTQSVSGVTSGEGKVSFSSGNANKNSSGQFIFTVNSLSLTGYTYLESDNIETSDCIYPDATACDGISAPTDLSASFNGTHVELSWSGVAQATSYNIYRSLDSGGYNSPVQSFVTNYLDSPVAPDTRYYYVISASDGVEESAVSQEVSVTTTISAPTELQADDVSLSLKRKGRSYDITAQVSVIDDSGSPAANAEVSGNWTLVNGTPQMVSGTTGANGSVSLKLSKVAAQSGDVFSFTVTNIERGGDSFDGEMTSGSVIVP
ncbi:DNRLRE domain-containing protein [Shewanella canadensis]|uniref:DNRLRE domain-containing protein n=1 Tax=Shewanella canadensis TaxID=271096 RepID=A0A3S0ILG7_9GAMM|nr:DNRLRE domain-containing protein [Shewanella canadensis]